MSLLIILHRDKGQEGTGAFGAPQTPLAGVSSDRAAPKEVPSPSSEGTFASQETQVQKVHSPARVLTPLQHLGQDRDLQVQFQGMSSPAEPSPLLLPRSHPAQPLWQQQDPRGAAEVPQLQPLAQGAHRQRRAHAGIPSTTFLQEQTALPLELFLHRCLKSCPRRGRNRVILEQGTRPP